MSAPIINPPTPYVCPLPGPFFPGQMVRVRGCAAPNGDRFDINFQTRETTYDTDDIAFHISVRLLQGYIARNSFRNGDWEEEEDYGDLPIMLGQHFEILILCEPTQFKVAINGRHYCDFKHRLSYSRISHFGIEGDVALSLIAFEGGQQQPAAYGGQQQPAGYGGQPQPTGYGGPPQPAGYGAQPQTYGMPQPGGMPTAPPSYSEAVNLAPMNSMPPSMGMHQQYAPGYSYPPM